ncbi:hypothetical protein RchiOBHm_Chr7g0211201 [Rosa chinensis]|uniref:Uncharacterized protein n=1 Tax=Rosa chinensis TaxID=74649 RepID=A0A2P6PAE4_ROSCH|nr:hypothetical protein RchiOBHm_Chr7g0211201 [Rosa chinensis]
MVEIDLLSSPERPHRRRRFPSPWVLALQSFSLFAMKALSLSPRRTQSWCHLVSPSLSPISSSGILTFLFELLLPHGKNCCRICSALQFSLK